MTLTGEALALLAEKDAELQAATRAGDARRVHQLEQFRLRVAEMAREFDENEGAPACPTEPYRHAVQSIVGQTQPGRHHLPPEERLGALTGHYRALENV